MPPPPPPPLYAGMTRPRPQPASTIRVLVPETASSMTGPPVPSTSMAGSQVRAAAGPPLALGQPPRAAEPHSAAGRAFCLSQRPDSGVPHPGRKWVPWSRQPHHLHELLLWPGRWEVGEQAGLVGEKGFPGRANSMCKGPEVGVSLTCVHCSPEPICMI